MEHLQLTGVKGVDRPHQMPMIDPQPQRQILPDHREIQRRQQRFVMQRQSWRQVRPQGRGPTAGLRGDKHRQIKRQKQIIEAENANGAVGIKRARQRRTIIPLVQHQPHVKA